MFLEKDVRFRQAGDGKLSRGFLETGELDSLLALRERKENGNRVSLPPSYLVRHPLSPVNGSIRFT